MDFGKRTIVVNGTKVSLDRSDLIIHSIDDAQRHAASEMAWWGSVWAAAEEEHLKADAYYRQWRARLKVSIMDVKPAPAEHKVNALIESEKRFYELKSAIAKAKQNVITAETMFKSYDKQGAMAKSIGDRMVKEITGQGRNTRVRPDSSSTRDMPKATADTAEKSRLKEILAGKKEKD